MIEPLWKAVGQSSTKLNAVLFSHRTTRYLPDWTENLPSHKKLHENIYSTFIHNHPKVETIKMSVKTGILGSHDIMSDDLRWNWWNNKGITCTINVMLLHHPEIILTPSHLLSMEKFSYTKPVPGTKNPGHCCFKVWLNEQTVALPYNGMLVSKKRFKLSSPKETLRNKPIWKGYILIPVTRHPNAKAQKINCSGKEKDKTKQVKWEF